MCRKCHVSYKKIYVSHTKSLQYSIATLSFRICLAIEEMLSIHRIITYTHFRKDEFFNVDEFFVLKIQKF